MIDPSISAKHGVTSRTAKTPNFVGTCEAVNAADRGAGRKTQKRRNAIAAPGAEHDLAAPSRVDVAPARQSVEHEPRQKAHRQTNGDRRGRHAHDRGGGPSRLGQKHRADDRRAAHHRADRQVDAAEQDDDGHSGRDEAGDRHLPQHVGQIVVGEKDVPARGRVRRGEGADQADDREPPIELGARKYAKRVHPARPAARSLMPGAAKRMIASWVASRAREQPGLAPFAHDQDAVRQQQQFRHFRAHDDDAEPARRELENELIDLLLGAHVDAARRLVEQQNAGLGRRATCR